MSATAAQDEFDELMRSKERRTQHPGDDDARSFLNLSSDDNEDHSARGAGPRTTRTTIRSRPSRNQDADEDYDDDDDDEDNDTYHPRPSLSKARHTIPRTRYGANTGPKGVISDAQNYRDSQRERIRSSRPVGSAQALPTRQLRNGLSLQEKPARGADRTFGGEKGGKEDTDEEDEEEDDDDDDEFMSAWRSNRLQQLQNGQYQSQMHSRERKSERDGGGRLLTVDASGYLDAVDNAPPEMVVAVYIYDDASEVSLVIEECLRAVAKTHGRTRFVRLHYTEAKMEPAGVPALIGYRGGEKFVGLVPLVYELPDDADLDSAMLASVLERHQII